MVSELRGQIVGVQTRAFSSPPDFQMWAEIGNSGGLDSIGILYGDGTPNTFTGGIWGLTVMENSYFATEFVDGAGTDCRLLTITDNGFITQAKRVSNASIGFPAVECLASVGDEILGMSVDYTAHKSNLIKIDPETGVGTFIGSGGFDAIIVGLAYHPVQGKLFGAGIPFASVQTSNLYEINLMTGATTLIGPLGAEIHGLAFHNELGLVGVFQKLYTIDTDTGMASAVDAEVSFSHDGNSSNGLYTLAAHSGIPDSGLPPFQITAVSLVDETSLFIEWETEAGGTYIVQSAQSISSPVTWEDASGELSATGNQLQHTVSFNDIPQQIIRVLRVE